MHLLSNIPVTTFWTRIKGQKAKWQPTKPDLAFSNDMFCLDIYFSEFCSNITYVTAAEADNISVFYFLSRIPAIVNV